MAPFDRPMLRLVLTVLLFGASAFAQERCACGAYIELPWSQRIQRSDGIWPVAASKDVAKHEHDDGSKAAPKLPGDAYPHQPEDLHVTAFYALAYSVDGSTLRSGPYRERLRRAAIWVRNQQDERGRYGFSDDRSWMLDHALVTTMLAEVSARGGSAAFHKNVDQAFVVLEQYLSRVRSADVELLVWTRMATAAARLMPDTVRPLQGETERAAWMARLDEIDAAVVRFAPDAMPDSESTDRRKLGAGVLLTSFLTPDGETPPGVDVSWFDSYDHPLATTYYALASYRAGGANWNDMAYRLRDHMVKTQVRRTFQGSWDPRGAYGETYGRIGTTGASIMTLMFYYRYARLAAVEI